MSFNIGLSALNAAQEEIAVTGNNIANASTNGFKSSRAEFADVYAASVLGGGARQQGGGVGLQAIAQNFSQGNISFTDNTLDLAINGGGFFILKSAEGGNVYTRAGAFGTDKNGNIVNKMGDKLQGFAAQNGKAAGGSGPLSDLVVTTGEISPKATTLVSSVINLDAGATPSSIIGSKVTSNNGIAGVPQLGVRVAREAQITGRISVEGTDFSGTTSARTMGTVNIQDGLDFTTAGAHSFSISVNGGAYSTIDLAIVAPAVAPVTAEEVRDHVQAQLDATLTPGSVVASVENNRLVLTTAAEGENSRINISAVQGLAASVVGTVDVVGKTAPPTGFRITLDGVSRDIVIDKNFTNSGAAALALGGGAGSGNEALEDYIQAQIDTSAGLIDKVDVSIDNLGNIVFKAATTGVQNLKIDPIITTAGSVNFNEIAEFSIPRRSGSLNLEKLDFSGTENSTSFTITVGTETQQITLNDDYSALGLPALGLGGSPESGLEALEDEIQSQINASDLPGKVKVSIGADGKFVFEITDPTETSLNVQSDSIAAGVSGGVDVSNGYNFTGGNSYEFNITYSIDGGTTDVTTLNPIILDKDYAAPDLVPAVQALIDEEFGFTPDNREVRVSLDPLTGALVFKTAKTGPLTHLGVAVTVPGVLPDPSVVGDTTTLLPDPFAAGDGPGLDFASVATFVGNELDNSGVGAVSNGYAAEVIEVLDNTGNKQLISVPQGASANAVAQLFSNVDGITAKATTVAYITDTNRGDPLNTGAGNADVDSNLPLHFAINGLEFESSQTDPANRYQELATQINASSGNLTAKIVDLPTGGKALEITENNGLNLVFSGGTTGKGNGSVTVNSSVRDPVTGVYGVAPNVPGTQLANLGNLTNDAVTVGGIVDFTLDEGVVMADARKTATGADIPPTQGSIFGSIDEAESLTGEVFELNTFDPTNSETYYRSTAVAVFDSLGNQHTLTQFFVKERPTSESPNGSLWSVYFQIDGKDIGYDSTSTDQTPTLAKATLRFNASGLYDTSQEPIYITNWTPLDAAGKPAGAGPVVGDTTVNDLTTNSNFRIDLSKLTQFGGDFAVKSNIQNGYASGQLTGLEIDTRGLIYARFSNGESTVLGEVALADFEDPSKLQNIGGTRFASTAESGEGTPSGAGTAGLGVIQSGALEDSNVDLSEQLVQLIVSQRNFQAAAQIIESIDTSTQTIINL